MPAGRPKVGRFFAKRCPFCPFCLLKSAPNVRRLRGVHHVAAAAGCGDGGAARESGDGRGTGPRGGLPHSSPGKVAMKVERWDMRKGEVWLLMVIESYIHIYCIYIYTVYIYNIIYICNYIISIFTYSTISKVFGCFCKLRCPKPWVSPNE